MRIGLIRHGRTEWNALGKIQGQTDTPLNEEGVRQAHALANRLLAEGQQWDGVVSSDLMRASETARIIASTLGIPQLPSDARLRERYFGVIEGTTEAERLAKWGANWRSADCGQESDLELRTRALSFVEDAMERYPGQNLLAVTHGSLLAQLLKGLCEELEDKPIGNMAFSIFERDDNRWRPLLHNCTLHLDQIQAESSKL
ncbi:putative phosphoglycerate mutase [Paenibacillus phyllosphaerae]|uniref:Putative phosphoglycerate mutase n=1 Tax=Paenibacillus phyllosphaerae TaxID=274593 RepID=A0A7W5FLJ5_9BACL|nr:histidine phosphatase family protein [Paenibacillus phyllosphaerae]MBB3109300.1 putative phosphoglycerate mutase [Paenibacillus phyllosphaerae]